MNALRITDVSLTDGQSACWSGAMTTPMALSVAGRLAAAMPAAIEVLSPAVLRQCVSRGEDPWQRLEGLRERCPGVVLRVALSLLTEHGRRGADVLAADVGAAWLCELARCRVGEVLLIDPLLDPQRLGALLDEAHSLGLTTIVALPFVQPSAYGDERYREWAATLAAAGADRVMLRDEAGLMTPERLATLLPALRAGLGRTPLDLHIRCQTALGPLVALEALRIGIDGLDTAFAPLANGASVPALGTLLKSLRLLGRGDAIGEQLLYAVGEADRQLAAIADRHGLEPASAWVFDLANYRHQLPGEVAHWAMRRLAQAGQAHRLHAFAGECERVRLEIGAPPMLAPFARPIAEQAWLHLQGQPRYAELRPGIRRTVQRMYGALPGTADASLAQRVGRPPIPPPHSLGALRSAHPGVCDAALVAALVCGVAPEALPAGTARPDLNDVATSPEEALLSGLMARAARYAQLSVHGPGVSIDLQGGGA
jgi:oxaloacetate decarboxylase (Na+ extruding) subunit alpha